VYVLLFTYYNMAGPCCGLPLFVSSGQVPGVLCFATANTALCTALYSDIQGDGESKSVVTRFVFVIV